MKHILPDQVRIALDRRVAEAEKRTGAQIVLAVVRRSDVYAELPWKAFALGAAVAGTGAVMFNLQRPAWNSGAAVLFSVVATLAVGAACALLCVLVPGFARLFLDAHRAEVEVKQYAESLFLSRELFATRDRIGVLLLVSMFERVSRKNSCSVLLSCCKVIATLLGSYLPSVWNCGMPRHSANTAASLTR